MELCVVSQDGPGHLAARSPGGLVRHLRGGIVCLLQAETADGFLFVLRSDRGTHALAIDAADDVSLSVLRSIPEYQDVDAVVHELEAAGDPYPEVLRELVQHRDIRLRLESDSKREPARHAPQIRPTSAAIAAISRYAAGIGRAAEIEPLLAMVGLDLAAGGEMTWIVCAGDASLLLRQDAVLYAVQPDRLVRLNEGTDPIYDADADGTPVCLIVDGCEVRECGPPGQARALVGDLRARLRNTVASRTSEEVEAAHSLGRLRRLANEGSSEVLELAPTPAGSGFAIRLPTEDDLPEAASVVSVPNAAPHLLFVTAGVLKTITVGREIAADQCAALLDQVPLFPLFPRTYNGETDVIVQQRTPVVVTASQPSMFIWQYRDVGLCAAHMRDMLAEQLGGDAYSASSTFDLQRTLDRSMLGHMPLK